jgi:uncharacterized pyridoxamine 5'-phosphate oxidase family protein
MGGMSVVAEFLKASGVQYLATVGLDGSPKVRPFQFMLEEGGKIYFCTSNGKKVFEEMRKEPRIELSACGEGSSWLRLSGRAVFVADIGLKEKAQEASPLVKSIYKTPDNPVFELFYLAEARAVLSDFSGNPPRAYDV